MERIRGQNTGENWANRTRFIVVAREGTGGMDKRTLTQPVGKMTVGKFKELLKEEIAEAEKQIAEAGVAYAADVEQQRPDLPPEDRSLGDMTVGELKELIREVLEEEQRRDYYIDEEGSLVFFSEEAYADYLDKQEGKLPSEVNAYFFDEQGWRCFYSDWICRLWIGLWVT